MMMNAVGTLISRIAVAATTNRTRSRFETMKSRIAPPKRTTTRTSPSVSTSSIGTSVKINFPASVSRLHERATAVTAGCPSPGLGAPSRRRPRAGPRAHSDVRERSRAAGNARIARPGRASLVDAAHDGVEAGHDRHRVGDEIAGRERTDGLEVDERRVVDPHPERLVRAVAHRVRRGLTARRLDGGIRPARPGPQEPRQLGHDRAVRHLVDALIDDPEALL